MKSIYAVILTLFVCLSASAQAVRVDPTPLMRTSGTAGPGGYPQLLAVPNARINICNAPANGVPCTNFVATYTDASRTTACPSSAQVTPAGTSLCVPATDNQGNFGFWIDSGSYMYTITLATGQSYGPYPITPGGSGGGGGSNQICDLQPKGQFTPIYAGCYGVATTNTPTQNDAAIILAFQAAYTAGQAHPADLIFPCGNIQVNTPVHQLQVTHVWGCGRGDAPDLVPPFGNGTNIQAAPTFHCPNASSQNAPNCAVWVQGGDGALSEEYFDSQLHNVQLDANGIAGNTFMRANCQEKCTTDHIIVQNITQWAFFNWGANNNGNSSSTNAAWGLPALYQGSADDGPDTNWEIYGNETVTHSTVPVVLANVATYHGFKDSSIVMVPEDQEGGVHTPDVAAWVWGTSTTLSDNHIEGPRDGWIVGPTGGADGQFGDGATKFTFITDQYSSSTATGAVVHFQNAKGSVALDSRGSNPNRSICDDNNNGYCGDDANYTTDVNPDTNFHSYMGSRAGIGLDQTIQTTSDVVAGHNVTGTNQVISPCLVTQIFESTPWSSPFHNICETPDGNIIITSTGPLPPSTNSPEGNIFLQGAQNFSWGIGVNGSGINISAPTSSTTNVYGVIGNNLAYDPHNRDGALPTFDVSNPGSAGANGWITRPSGWIWVGNDATPAQYTPATVFGWQSVAFNNDGTQQFGGAGVAAAPVTTIQNSGGTCTIDPSQPAALQCNHALTKTITLTCGTLTITSGIITATTCP